MKIIKLNINKGFAKILINSLDDLWHLSKIIEEGDLIKSRSERKVKFGGDTEKQRVVRKPVVVKIRVQNTVLNEASLRVQGEVMSGPESIPLHSMHTIDLHDNIEFEIEKSKWLNFQIARLKTAEKESVAPKILICLMDDEEANLAHLTPSGIKPIAHMTLRLTKKRLEEKKSNDIEKVANEVVDKSKGVDKIILGSPLFWKETLLKEVRNKSYETAEKVILADVSTGSKKGFNEIVSRKIIDKIIKDSQLAKEDGLINALLEKISTNIDMVVYGIDATMRAAEAGALHFVAISEKLMNRDNENFESVKTIIEQVEKSRGEVHIFNSKSEAGKQLIGLGGIGGILRYQI
jgi:protein pelota